MKMELVLVRHGETTWNAGGRFCGRSDPPLTPRGRGQARALRILLLDEVFDRFISSPSARALETARLAYGEPSIDARLRELDFGELEGRAWMDCSADTQQRLLDYDNFQAPKGESVRELGERVLAALWDLGPGKHLVVTHGGVIRFLAGRASVIEYPKVATITRLRMMLSTGVSGALETRCELIAAHPAGIGDVS